MKIRKANSFDVKEILRLLINYGNETFIVEEEEESVAAMIINELKDGKLVIGLGASTKGNVLMQFVGITLKDIPYIGEVNTDKFGCYTPGTLIPIISEDEARKMNPDYFFVFPWHFKEFILEKEKVKLNKKTSLLFPLPTIETF